jgi:hypothetical protein
MANSPWRALFANGQSPEEKQQHLFSSPQYDGSALWNFCGLAYLLLRTGMDVIKFVA